MLSNLSFVFTGVDGRARHWAEGAAALSSAPSREFKIFQTKKMYFKSK